ncbi:MAG: hypothetical protein K2Y22_09390 [Candidatus Obscuribacterales bacterium]|nr:hypothetical protein [Candidatus Obscuribacterales bacterium]
MLRDLTNPKKIDKQVVLAAISALRSRAWDINPYTVADEMKTARTNIYRNSEAMELINEARQKAGLPMIHTDEAVPDAPHETSEGTQSVAALQERVHQLELENTELLEQQKDNWQRGYKAGWDEASIYLVDGAPFPEESRSAFTEEAPSEPPAEENTFNAYDRSEQYSAPQSFDYSYDEPQEAPPPAWSEDLQYQSEIQSHDQQLDQTEGQDEQHDEMGNTISTEELRNILKQHRDKTEADPAQGKGKGLAASGFARTSEQAPKGFILRTVPPDIRKSCLVLGIRPEELSRQVIMEAWKREITRPGTHPDQGGDSEIAVYLNTAKDVLLRWWETQEPKLGKQFGTQSKPQPGAESDPDETEPSM